RSAAHADRARACGDHRALQGHLPLADRRGDRIGDSGRACRCRGPRRFEVRHRGMAASGAVTAPESDRPTPLTGAATIIEGDNLVVAATLPSASFTLVYLDPPFNTGRTQERQVVTARRSFTNPQESAGVAEPGPESGGADGVSSAELRSSEPGPAVPE